MNNLGAGRNFSGGATAGNRSSFTSRNFSGGHGGNSAMTRGGGFSRQGFSQGQGGGGRNLGGHQANFVSRNFNHGGMGHSANFSHGNFNSGSRGNWNHGGSLNRGGNNLVGGYASYGRGYGRYGNGYGGYGSGYGGYGRGYGGYGRGYGGYGRGYGGYGLGYGGWGGYGRYGFYPWGLFLGYGSGWGWPYWGYGGWGGYGLGYGGWGGYGLGYGGYGYGNAYGYGNSYGSTYYTANTPVVAVAAPVPPTAPGATDYVTMGEQSFRAGSYQQALQNWQHAMVDNPDNGAVVMLMAQAMFALGLYEEAAGTVQMGMQMLPEAEWGGVITNYTQLYGAVQDYTNQLKTLETARDAKPNDPAIRFLLGYHFGYLGYPQQAVRELDKALDIQPRDFGSEKLRDSFAAAAGLPARAHAPHDHPAGGAAPAAPAVNGLQLKGSAPQGSPADKAPAVDPPAPSTGRQPAAQKPVAAIPA